MPAPVGLGRGGRGGHGGTAPTGFMGEWREWHMPIQRQAPPTPLRDLGRYHIQKH
ncbi:MAG: hypothetical protein F6J93_39555 [Oscillatoria sp. SIO1A7]|nr:hypothetical protein [Oscillatoria sp. SIO1A7]